MLTHNNYVITHNTYLIYIIIMYTHNNYVKLHKTLDGGVKYVNYVFYVRPKTLMLLESVANGGISTRGLWAGCARRKATKRLPA